MDEKTHTAESGLSPLPQIHSVNGANPLTAPDITHTPPPPPNIPDEVEPSGAEQNLSAAIVPSTKRCLVRESTTTFNNTIKEKGSMDSLIDSLKSPSPSPSAKATRNKKLKAAEVAQSDAPTADDPEPSILPGYLISAGSKRETIMDAMKRTDSNLAILASRIEGTQADILDEMKNLRRELTLVAKDVSSVNAKTKADTETRSALTKLITSHNELLDSFTEAKGLLTAQLGDHDSRT
jgi:hypothetical protein